MIHQRFVHHSAITNPGATTRYMTDFSSNIAELIELTSGLLIHFENDVALLNAELVKARRSEIDSRYVTTMLGKILAMDDAPLKISRAPEKRLLSTCRDSAVLLCAILRSCGIPARVRYGFAHFFYEPRQVMHDHVVVEYWREENWRIADARLSHTFRQRHNLTHLDPANISTQLFLNGGEAWKRIRRGELPARALSAMRGDDKYGLWKARNLLIYDLSSLSGNEPLLWDAWGVMLLQPQGVPPQEPEQFEFLDMMANLATVTPQECETLAGIFNATEGICAPDKIMSFSPVVGKKTVHLIGTKVA